MVVAQEQPEPGAIPVRSVKVRELVVPARAGDDKTALKTFLTAHSAHKKGDLDAALKGYIAFLGYRSRDNLPPRYETTTRRRLRALRKAVAEQYQKAVKLYAKDGAKGVAALKALAAKYAMLPEGVAAQRLWHSDALHAALAAARGSKDKAAAIKALEKAIRAYPDAVNVYEAKSTLLEMGGPDLFEPGERVADGGDDDDEDSDDDDDEGETVIEDGGD